MLSSLLLNSQTISSRRWNAIVPSNRLASYLHNSNRKVICFYHLSNKSESDKEQ
jgi:hypothetical protein